ncbi:uncharacterized protein DMAD_11230, partial [Drosophila madeirensis]
MTSTALVPVPELT